MNLVSSIQIDEIYIKITNISHISTSYGYFLYDKTKIITEFLTDNLEEDNQLLFIYQ